MPTTDHRHYDRIRRDDLVIQQNVTPDHRCHLLHCFRAILFANRATVGREPSPIDVDGPDSAKGVGSRDH